MAKEIVLNLKVNNEGTKSIGELKGVATQTLKTLNDMEEAAAQLNAQLRQTEVGTAEYKELSQQLRIVNTELKNSDLALEALDNEQLGSSIKGLAGGLTDVAGGLALIGLQGESIEKIAATFAQVEGLSKIIGGTFDVWNEGLKVVKNLQDKAALATNALVAAQEAQAVATTATEAATGKATVAQKIYNTVANANPIFLLVTALVAVTAGFIALSAVMSDQNSELERSIELRGDINDALVESRKGYADEKAALAANLAIARDDNQSKKDRETAIKNLNALSPEYLGNITLETINTKGATSAIDDYVNSLDKKAKAQAYNNILAKEYEKQAELMTQSGAELVGFWDQAGNSVKATIEELGKGNIGALNGLDQETLMNTIERNAKRGVALKNQELKGSQEKIDKILELIKAETSEGAINTELSDEALSNIDKQKSAYDALLKARLDASKALYAELQRLLAQEELDFAKTEDEKNRILADREIARLEQIYETSNKTLQDQANLTEALLVINQNYLRKKAALEQKAADEAAKASRDVLNGELDELEEQADRIRKFRQTSQEKEEEAINDYYFRIKELAKKNGEDVAVIEEAQAEEIAATRAKYRKEEEEADKKAEEEKLARQIAANEAFEEHLRGTTESVAQILTGNLSGAFDEINAGFAVLQDLIFGEEGMFGADAQHRLFGEEGIFANMKLSAQEAAESIGETIMLITDVLAEFSQAKLEEQLESSQALYEEQSNQYAEALANREITQAEYDAKVKQLEQQKRDRDRKADQDAFKRAKTLALVNAAVGTAQAVINAFSSGAAVPIIGAATGAVYAGIAGALGAAQIAIIASQQYKAARGGIVPGTLNPEFDSVPALLAPGEAVINSRSAAMYPELLSEINQVGGGVALTPARQSDNKGGMQSTDTSEYGNTKVIEAVVSEQTITATQESVDRQKRRQRFLN